MKKTIRDYELNGKKVIIRCDFNVPMKDGKIIDDNRLVMSLETINYAINNGAKLILMSHLGRIKEESDKEKNSLRLVSLRLSELLGKEVLFVPSTRGEELEKCVNELNERGLIVEGYESNEAFFNDLKNKCYIPFGASYVLAKGMNTLYANDLGE